MTTIAYSMHKWFINPFFPLTSDYDLTPVIASALHLLETGEPQPIWRFTAEETISKDKIISKNKILPPQKLKLKFQ